VVVQSHYAFLFLSTMNKQEVKTLKVGPTTFYLNSLVGMPKQKFMDLYCPNGIKINGIRWEPLAVWGEIQKELIRVGLKEDDRELRKVHAK